MGKVSFDCKQNQLLNLFDFFLIIDGLFYHLGYNQYELLIMSKEHKYHNVLI